MELELDKLTKDEVETDWINAGFGGNVWDHLNFIKDTLTRGDKVPLEDRVAAFEALPPWDYLRRAWGIYEHLTVSPVQRFLRQFAKLNESETKDRIKVLDYLVTQDNFQDGELWYTLKNTYWRTLLTNFHHDPKVLKVLMFNKVLQAQFRNPNPSWG